MFFFDYDLDGWLDIFAANGHIEEEIGRVQPKVQYRQPPLLFRNLGARRFEDASAAVGAGLHPADRRARRRLRRLRSRRRPRRRPHHESRTGVSLSATTAAIATTGSRSGPAATKSNRDGIGAVVRVTSAGGRQWQMVRSGSSYASQSELTLTFGLGADAAASSIEVEWPSGARDRATTCPLDSWSRLKKAVACGSLTSTMWSRRRFLEIASGLPLVGSALGTTAVATAAAPKDLFADLGVRPFINAAGTYTAMTSSLMPPEVMEAINYASKHYVMLDELHDRVGERIASMVRCEAAMVTSGAAAALTLGTAAVLTGTDRQKIVSLPNLTGMKSEVIIQKSHRFGYDHAVRNCGVRMVEVESRDDLERAINEKTAMMLFYNANNFVGQIKDEEFAQLGKKHGIPTLNDAAADVPPVENLWRYTGMGFDLVAFSGGKGIRGPQSSGLLLGRKDLIAAARLNGPPNSDSIGRGMKVNKEEMLGLLVAVDLYVKKNHEQERREFDARAEAIQKSAADVPGVKAEIFVPEVANHVPHVRISWDAAAKGMTAADVVRALRDGEPSIGTRSEGATVVVGVWMMRPGEEKIVARRLRQVLSGPRTSR